MFFGILWGMRTVMEALSGRRGLRWQTFTTLGLLLVGGMILGPVVQKYAFGVFWTGVPWGWDLTDNKTLVRSRRIDECLHRRPSASPAVGAAQTTWPPTSWITSSPTFPTASGC